MNISHLPEHIQRNCIFYVLSGKEYKRGDYLPTTTLFNDKSYERIRSGYYCLLYRGPDPWSCFHFYLPFVVFHIVYAKSSGLISDIYYATQPGLHIGYLRFWAKTISGLISQIEYRTRGSNDFSMENYDELISHLRELEFENSPQ